MRHKFNVGDKVRYTYPIDNQRSGTVIAKIEKVIIVNFSKIIYKAKYGGFTTLLSEEELEAIK